MINNKLHITFINREQRRRCGVLDHMLGLRED
jgi:hypothetical protein